MPQNAKKKWNENSEDAAQLFRDLYFGKYSDSTKPSDIYDDPTRPYSDYNKTSFYRHVKKFRNKVENYKKFQTGLTEKFRDLCRLHEPPLPGDAAPRTGTEEQSYPHDSKWDSDDDDDSTFVDNTAEEDIDLDADFVNEKDEKDEPKTSSSPPQQDKPAMKKKTQQPPSSLLGDFVEPYPDGRVWVNTLVDAGVHSAGDIKFEFAEDGCSLRKKIRVQIDEVDVDELLGGIKGIDLNKDSAHEMIAQAAIEKRLEGNTSKNEVWVDAKDGGLIELPWRVCKYFVGPDGKKDGNKMYPKQASTGTLRLNFWLIGVHAVEKEKKPEATSWESTGTSMDHDL